MRPAPFTLTRCLLVTWFTAVAGFHPCRAKAVSPQVATRACCHQGGDCPVAPPTPGCAHCGTAVPGVLADVQPFTASPDFGAPLFDPDGDLEIAPRESLVTSEPAIDPSPPHPAHALSTCARLL